MAACGSIQHIFENPIPDNPSLRESLSPWKQIKPQNHNASANSISLDQHQQMQQKQSSFAEIFGGELDFKDSPEAAFSPDSSSFYSSSSKMVDSDPETQNPGSFTNPASFLEQGDGNKRILAAPAVISSCPASPRRNYSPGHRSSNSFSSMNSESLQLCTEGLGFESFDDVEDLKLDIDDGYNYNRQSKDETGFMRPARNDSSSVGKQPIEFRRSKSCLEAFPPPISSISTSGKPWVCFKSYRENGRFVLKEVRIPTKECLRASREDGRLKLHFVQPDDELHEESEDEDDVEEEGIKNEEEDGNETSRIEARGDS